MTQILDGVEINESGAKQSCIGARFDLVPAVALRRVAEILHKGAEKYEEDNWRGLSSRSCLNHALAHIYAHLAGESCSHEDDLGHAACRLLMALELKLTGGRGYLVPENQGTKFDNVFR